MTIEIPEEYTVGGQLLKVDFVDSLDGKLGTCCLGAGFVRIAHTFNGERQSETSKQNTFYHEMTHTILDTMGRNDLSGDEVFVNSFTSFLLEALKSFKFNNNKDETVQIRRI